MATVNNPAAYTGAPAGVPLLLKPSTHSYFLYLSVYDIWWEVIGCGNLIQQKKKGGGGIKHSNADVAFFSTV